MQELDLSQVRNILLDRDGTIICEKEYLCEPEKVSLIPGAGKALRTLTEMGFSLFLVSNQSGLGRGYFSMTDYQRVRQRLASLLAEEGVEFKQEVICPHAPEETCNCRKPDIGLWYELKRLSGLKAEESIMIGDKLSDILFAARARLRASILVLTGYGDESVSYLGLPQATNAWQIIRRKGEEFPHAVARDIVSACSCISKNINSA